MTLDPELTHNPRSPRDLEPSGSKAIRQLLCSSGTLYPGTCARPWQAGAREVSPSWQLSSPARLPAGPAHPNCSRYGRLRGCDTLRGRGPETDMLGQQLPCSITVPAEGRDLGRSQWHLPSYRWLADPAPLLPTPGAVAAELLRLVSPKSSPVSATHVCTHTPHPPRDLHWKAVEKYFKTKCSFLTKCS